MTGKRRFGEFGGEWREVRFDDICESMVSGGTPSTQIKEYWQGKIPWITGADFANMRISKIRRYITKEAVTNSSTKVIGKGNILIVTRTGVGKVAIAPVDIAISQDTTGIILKADVADTQFLLFALVWTIPQLAKYNQGTSINGITRQDLKKHKILLPPLPEQRCIAFILSTWDEAITLTERLMAAKKRRKKALMQQLLTGKRRFGDMEQSHIEYRQTSIGLIPKDWKVKQLGEIGTFRKGKNIPKSLLTSQGVPCVLYGEIYTKYHFKAKKLESFIPPSASQQSIEIKKGDILFAGSGETLEEIGKCFTYLGDEKSYAGGDLIILTPNEDDSTFLGYLLNSSQIRRQKFGLGQGSSIVHIYSSSLKSIMIPLPPLPEQRCIAEVLQACDEESDLLAQKLAALQRQKKALMQQLLTGKRRCV